MLIQMPIDAAPEVIQRIFDQFAEESPSCILLPIGWNVNEYEPDLPEYVI